MPFFAYPSSVNPPPPLLSSLQHTHAPHTHTHTGDSANVPLLPPLATDYCSGGWYHGVLCAGRTQVWGAGGHGKNERFLCMLPLR